MKCPACDQEGFPGDDQCSACGTSLIDVSLPQPLSGRLHELILEDPLRRLNAPKPITLKKSDPVSRAVELMRKHRFGSVLVLDEARRLAGIFTERDLLCKLPGRDEPLTGITLDKVMTENPQTLREDDTIALALNRMSMGGYRHVPIVRDGVPVGFVSIRGILKYIARNALGS
jgi:CBS domain-containing protein